MLIGAWYGFAGHRDSDWYNLLLRGVELDQAMTLNRSNEILHLAGSIYLILDWLCAPGRRVIPWRRFWVVLAFPVAWLIYTMIRGPIAGWYPYPFLDPALAERGYASVVVYILAIAAFIGGIGIGIVGISRSNWPRRAETGVIRGAPAPGLRD